MRNYLYLFIFCFIAYSCVTKSESDIVLSFEVDHKPKYDLVISYMKNNMIRIPIDSIGEGKYIINDMNSGYITLHNGLKERRIIYVEKGDHICIKYDGESFANSLSINGIDSSVSQYLADLQITWLPDSNYKFDISCFNEKLQAQLKSNLQSLENYNFQGNNARFRKLEENRIRYMMSMALLQYPEGHRWATQTNYIPEETYYEVLKQWMIEDEDLLEIPEYLTFMTEGAAFIAGKQSQFEDLYKRTLGQINFLKTELKDKKIIEYLISNLSCSYIREEGINKIAELDSLHKSFVCNKSLQNKYNRIYTSWEKLLPGKLFPYFEALDTLGETKVLSNYKGSNVCLYIWQSYYPCITEFAYLKDLQSFFDSKNIKLICVSLDEQKKKWISTIRNEDINYVEQLYLGNNRSFQESIKYRAIKMSHLCLLDSTGHIIAWELPKPSSGKLKEFIEQKLL